MSTLPRARKIVVDTPTGKTLFFWNLGSGKGHLMGMSGPGVTLTVMSSSSTRAILQMSLASKTYAAQNSYDEEHTGVKSSLTPKDVKCAIEYALRAGWNLNEKRVFSPKGPLDLEEYELLP